MFTSLQNPELRKQILDYSTRSIGSWLQSYVINYFSKGEVTELNPKVEALLSVLAYAIPTEEWLPFIEGLSLMASELDNLISGGASLVTLLLAAGDNSGWLTSKGAPYTVQLFNIDGHEYIGASIGTVTFAFAKQPNITRQPVIVNVGKEAPHAIRRALRFLPGSIASLAKYIEAKIQQGMSHNDLKRNLENRNFKDILASQLGISQDKLAGQYIDEVISAVTNYLYQFKQQISLPDIPEERPDVSSPSVSLDDSVFEDIESEVKMHHSTSGGVKHANYFPYRDLDLDH